MHNDILDRPDTVTLTIFDNKTGGTHTTPFFYIGLLIFIAGMRIFGIFGGLISIPFFFATSHMAINVTQRMMCSYYTVCGIRIGNDS